MNQNTTQDFEGNSFELEVIDCLTRLECLYQAQQQQTNSNDASQSPRVSSSHRATESEESTSVRVPKPTVVVNEEDKKDATATRWVVSEALVRDFDITPDNLDDTLDDLFIHLMVPIRGYMKEKVANANTPLSASRREVEKTIQDKAMQRFHHKALEKLNLWSQSMQW